MSRMRKHAGRPGRKKWARILDLCQHCNVRRWLDQYRNCKRCRRAVIQGEP
jgi:hypothetical protein